MAGLSAFFTPGRVKNINLVCLFLAICWVVFLPLKKEIWYDETVSVIFSKGFTLYSSADYTGQQSVTSTTLARLNTPAKVFNATVTDNGNSYLYYISLHWFTSIFGNSQYVYLLLSRLCGAATLIAFFMLCGLFLQQSIFTSLALLLFTSDTIFWGGCNEIRGYIMGILFITLSGAYCYKFLFKQGKPIYLMLTGIFAVGAVLSHYFSVYAILVFIVYIILIKKKELLSGKNILAILVPVALMGIYIICAYSSFRRMAAMHDAIKEMHIKEPFEIARVFFLAMKFTALNFKFVYPAFKAAPAIIIVSFLMVIGVYVAAIKMAATEAERKNLRFLFITGFISTLFLLFLCCNSKEYTFLYARYFSFCVPFATLYVVYALKVFFDNAKMKLAPLALLLLIIVPCITLFLSGIIKNNPEIKYNHVAIAKKITAENIASIEIPDWRDAFMIQGFLPAGTNINYIFNATSQHFILHKPEGVEKIPVIRIDNKN